MSINKAEVGRFDGDYKIVAFNEGDKVSTLLTKANITLGSGEGLNNDSGEDVSNNDVADDGETYSIVENYKQGNEDDEGSSEDKADEEAEPEAE